MKANFPKIYFIRHGETDWNKQHLVQSTADNDLNATGVAQAEAIAKALHDMEPELRNFDFYSSPQIRAQHTMQIICTAQPRDFATVKTDARLRELEFGIWEGKKIEDLHNSPGYPIGQVEHYNWKPEGGESYAEGVARVDSFVRDMKGPSLIVVSRCNGALLHWLYLRHAAHRHYPPANAARLLLCFRKWHIPVV